MRKASADYAKYKIRTCQWMNECALCKKAITSGQRYHDGGYGRRAHVECVTNPQQPQEEGR